MTVDYREFAVPVDPEFAHELKAHLDGRRVRQHGSLKPSPADDQAIQRPRITEVRLVLNPDKQPDHRWRRVGLLAAAVVAVLAAGTVLVLATADDDADPQPAATLPPESSAPATVAPPESTAPATVAPPSVPDAQEAIGIAQRFVEARDAWDGEAVRALVTDDALIYEFSVKNADDYLPGAELEQAIGWRYMAPECTATPSDPPVEVICTYTMQNAWSQALGVGPFTGSSFRFLIADGQIQQVRNNFDFDVTQYDAQVNTVFNAWLTATYPGDVELMWESGGARLTPEAIALFEQHTTEFVASRNEAGSG